MRDWRIAPFFKVRGKNSEINSNSSHMVGQRALYPGNGVGDRSQTWSKVSSKVLLLKYSAIAIFTKIAIWRVFLDTVTFKTN